MYKGLGLKNDDMSTLTSKDIPENFDVHIPKSYMIRYYMDSVVYEIWRHK